MKAPWGVRMGVNWLVIYTGGTDSHLVAFKSLQWIQALTVLFYWILSLFLLCLQDAKIEPEEFTSRLQAELKSSPQPYLVPFLKVCFVLLFVSEANVLIRILDFSYSKVLLKLLLSF